MIAKILDFVKEFVDKRFYDIIMFIIIVLLLLLSFSAGYITAKYQLKEPIQIYNNAYTKTYCIVS